MKVFILLIILITTCTPCPAQDDEVIAHGIPPLTRRMADRIVSYYTYMLNVDLSLEDKKTLEQALVGYWQDQNYDKMGGLTVVDEEAIQLFGADEGQRGILRIQTRDKILLALKEDGSDPFSRTLLAAHAVASINRQISCAAAEPPAPAAGIRIGRYSGIFEIMPGGSEGKMAVDIKSMDASGGVLAKVIFYAGFEGEGDLTGTAGRSGTLALSGSVGPDKVCLKGKIAGNEFAGAYSSQGENPETGSFKIPYIGPKMNNPVNPGYPGFLIGQWKFVDYNPGSRPSPMAPNRTAGVSRLWTLQFFEDNTYKYIETNRLCPTGSSCCRNNNQLEKGTFKVSGTGFTFTFQAGDMMHTDECNPRASALAPMKASDAHLRGLYKWAMGPNEQTKALTFCIQKDGSTVCFERVK